MWFTKYSKLISCLLLTEQNNDSLMKKSPNTSNWFHTIPRGECNRFYIIFWSKWHKLYSVSWSKCWKFNRRGHRLVVVITAVVVIEEDMTAITIRTVVVIMKISQVLKRTIVWATWKKGRPKLTWQVFQGKWKYML